MFGIKDIFTTRDYREVLARWGPLALYALLAFALLAKLAPVVMGALGKTQRENKLDSS